MGFNADLLVGLATLLRDGGQGQFSQDGSYADDRPGIYLGTDPGRLSETLTMNTYPVEDTDLTNVTVGVQMRLRGGRDPLRVSGRCDDLYDLLHNRQHYQLNGVHVNLSWRQSGTWVGQDSDQRMERVENFYFRAERPAPYKLD